MFGTFRYNTDTNDVEHVQLERIDGFEARGYTRNACNSCRARKLKCSGDKNSCERCRATSKPCIYPSHVYRDSSADKIRRQPKDTSFEKEGKTVLASNNQPEVVAANARAEASEMNSSTSPTTFPDLSWTLPSTPSGSDLLWDLSSGENHQATDNGQNSLFGTIPYHKPASDDCSLSEKGTSLQSPIENIEFGADMAGILYDFSPKQPSNPIPISSSISSATLSTSEMLNADQSFSEASQKRNMSFSREVHDAHTCETEGLQGSAEPWGAAFKLSSSVGPHVHRSRVSQIPGSCANGLAAPAMPSLSAMSRHAATPMSTSSRPSEHTMTPAPGSTCLCVSMMLETLEKMGTQGSDARDRDSGVGLDVVLMALAYGMNTTEQILACRQCNACIDNSMLLAAVSQQLGMVAETVVACWPSQERLHGRYASQKRRRHHKTSSPSLQLPEFLDIATSGSTVHPLSNDNPIHDMSRLLEAEIVLESYEIQVPEIRLRLVHYALLLHVDKLCTVLGHIKNRIGSNWGARKLVVNIESRVRVFLETLRSRLSHPQITLEPAATSGFRA